MFSDIHHVSYLVPDLNAAIKSYTEMFGAVVTGRGAVDNLGEVAFLQVGSVEVEFIRPRCPPAPHLPPSAGRSDGWCYRLPTPWASGSTGNRCASER